MSLATGIDEVFCHMDGVHRMGYLFARGTHVDIECALERPCAPGGQLARISSQESFSQNSIRARAERRPLQDNWISRYVHGNHTLHGGGLCQHKPLCGVAHPVWHHPRPKRTQMEVARVLWGDKQLPSTSARHVPLLLLPLGAFPISISGQPAEQHNSQCKE